MTLGKLGARGGLGSMGQRGGTSAPGIRLSASSLAENSAEGTAVGTLSVYKGAGTYTFTLTDSAGTRFKVAGTNGVNLQAGATASNAEVASYYNIIVHADNGAGSTFDRTFTITISDVNEATPVITSNGGGSTATVSIAYNATAITTVTATDADVSAVIAYSISGGADAAKFAINSSTGVLSLNSVQTAGDYVVIVQASDGTNTDTQTITVTVNAAPSAPVNTVAPAVTGTETEGETLTSTSGTWTGTATITYAYQWYQAVLDGSDNVVTDMSGVPLRDDPISAATSSTYVLQAGDVGEKIFCYVTASNGVGSASKASNATGLIAAASSEDSATTAWVSAVVAAGGTVSGGRRTIVNTLVAGLKSDGIFAKLDRLWLFAAENSQSALIDLIADASATPVSAPTFTTDRGYAGNGSTSYIDTGFNPASGTPHYTQNSASFGLWGLTATPSASGGRFSGTIENAAGNNGTNLSTKSPFLSDLPGGNINRNTSNQTSGSLGTDAKGFVMLNRSGAGDATADEQLYKNGSSIGSSFEVSVSPPSLNLWIGARNFSGTVNQPTDDQFAAVSLGGSLNSTEAGNLYTRLTTYLTAVGAV